MVSTSTTKKSSLPAGDYRIVAWDLDTTGRRLIDEFCHIAAYSADSKFSQYVMPYRDLDLLSKRRYLIRTVNVGRYRMLKDIKNGKILKTKSDITSLQDFLSWLEKINGDGPGVLLLHYETFKLIPFLLLQTLSKYNLLEKFSYTVKGFADCYGLVKEKCEKTLNSFSLKTVSKVLLDKDGELFNAGQRAELAYQVVQHLTAGETHGEGDVSANRVMVDALLKHSSSISDELNSLEQLKVILKRQNTLWPIFSPYSRASIPAKKNASAMKRLLADAVLDYDTLKALWEKNKKEALEIGVKEKLPDATEEQFANIIKTLVEHFDPDINPVIPERKPMIQGRGGRFKRNFREKPPTKRNTESSTSPDTPTSSTPSKTNGLESPKSDDSPKHEPKVEPPSEPVQKVEPKAESPPKSQQKPTDSPKNVSKPISPVKKPTKPTDSPKVQRKTEVKSPPKTAESPKRQAVPPTPVHTPTVVSDKK